MTVWIVTQSFPTLDVVNDNLEIENMEAFEIIGVYDSESAARKIQEDFINQNAHDVIAFGSDPIEVEVSEWEVEGGF